MLNLVAFAGYARSGKDVAAQVLIEKGYKRVAFGDIIKRQVDGLVRQHLGFSAFTENDAQKRQIRGLLEQWGEANYDGVMKEFFDSLPDRAVNTRLVRAREAREWLDRGGVIIRVRRPGILPATDWERERLSELYDAGLISAEVDNDKDPQYLWGQVVSMVGLPV